MSRKILKVLTVVLLLALLTMPNFIYVGAGLVSYAESATATSHQNVEFDAKLKEYSMKRWYDNWDVISPIFKFSDVY